MVLFWHGQNSISVNNGEASLMVNPLDLERELKKSKSPDVVLLTQNQAAKIPAQTSSFVIGNPGEYDVKGFFIMGFGNSGKNIPFTIETEGIRLCYINGSQELADAELENLSSIDILFIDIGDSDESQEASSKLVNKIEPRIVVPMGFSAEKKPSMFLKEMGSSDVESLNKLNIKKKDLPQEETELKLLNAVK